MLGPTRLVIRSAGSPAGYAEWERPIVLTWRSQGDVFMGWESWWQAIFPGITFNLFLTAYDLPQGLWRVSVDINTSPVGGAGGAFREMVNFTWQFPPLALTEGITAWGNFLVYRVGEWQTISKRFDSPAFADDF